MVQHIQSNGLPQVGQQAVRALEEQWRPLWQAPGRSRAPHQSTPATTGRQSPAAQPCIDFQKYYKKLDGHASPLPQLPPILLQRLIEVLGTYKATTGLGIDEQNPRSWLLLPPIFLIRLITIIHSWEQHPAMIEELKHRIVFKAKPEGGFRPIAQMVSLLRVWGKLRHDMAAEWERQPGAFLLGRGWQAM